MTKEEAISVLEQAELKVGIKWRNGRPEVYISPYLQEAIDFALTKLRPISREQVEKAWRGEWMFPIFADQQDANDPRLQCSECESIETPLARHRFCPSCGAPMTDEAAEMMMKRLEGIK